MLFYQNLKGGGGTLFCGFFVFVFISCPIKKNLPPPAPPPCASMFLIKFKTCYYDFFLSKPETLTDLRYTWKVASAPRVLLIWNVPTNIPDSVLSTLFLRWVINLNATRKINRKIVPPKMRPFKYAIRKTVLLRLRHQIRSRQRIRTRQRIVRAIRKTVPRLNHCWNSLWSLTSCTRS
jgi:hypothetical protein